VLTASGVPSGFNYNFAPSSITPNGSAATSVLTIQAVSGSRSTVAAAAPPAGTGSSSLRAGSTRAALSPSARWYGAAFVGELAMLAFVFARRRKRIFAAAGGRLAFAVLVGALAITFMAGCSAKSPSKTFTITVTGTGGTQTSTTTISATLPIS
jgi:hypothetical protein